MIAALIATGLLDPAVFMGAVSRGWAITIGGPRKMNFPKKETYEVRNASADFSPGLAAGKELSGNPTVSPVVGDISILSVVRIGPIVHFTVAGGTLSASVFQTIEIACATTEGQVLGDTIAIPLR